MEHFSLVSDKLPIKWSHTSLYQLNSHVTLVIKTQRVCGIFAICRVLVFARTRTRTWKQMAFSAKINIDRTRARQKQPSFLRQALYWCLFIYLPTALHFTQYREHPVEQHDTRSRRISSAMTELLKFNTAESASGETRDPVMIGGLEF